METSTYARRARENAAILVTALDREHPSFREVLDQKGARAAVEELLHLSVTVVDEVGPGCSVAGSCDRETGAITVVRATPGRMTFTTLHELGHVRGHRDIDFQESLSQAAEASRRDVEEDACEAFAAELLLPPAVVDPVIDRWGATARGMAALAGLGRASREASAVAIAHRMAAPGYVAIIDIDDRLQFAARSGDVLPLRRDSDQGQSVVRHVHDGRQRYRGPGVLTFGSGAPTDEMHVDLLADGPVVYVVATTDSAPWVKVSLRSPFSAPTDGWCDHCQTAFLGGGVCSSCGELVHATCGHCGCAVPVRTTQRVCSSCWLERPVTMFTASSTICSECSG